MHIITCNSLLQYVKALDPPISKTNASLPCNEMKNRYINIMASEPVYWGVLLAESVGGKIVPVVNGSSQLGSVANSSSQLG